LDYDPREVAVALAIIDNARRVLLVCDQTKLERSAPVRIGHMSEIDAFVTDRLVSTRLRDVCAAHGVNVIETSAAAAAPPNLMKLR
jgi:DeoR family glycerol-3-phosphate regulon repressor